MRGFTELKEMMNKKKYLFVIGFIIFTFVYIYSIILVNNDEPTPIDYSDPTKEHLTNSNVTKGVVYDIIINNFPHKSLISYSINMEELNLEIKGITYDIMWLVELNIIDVYDDEITYIIYLDVYNGDILQVKCAA